MFYVYQLKKWHQVVQGGKYKFTQAGVAAQLPHLFVVTYTLFYSAIYERIVQSDMITVLFSIQQKSGSVILFVCLMFYVNQVQTVSLLNHTFSWASLTKQLTSTLCTYMYFLL